jgi:hypothetical protein
LKLNKKDFLFILNIYFYPAHSGKRRYLQSSAGRGGVVAGDFEIPPVGVVQVEIVLRVIENLKRIFLIELNFY